MIEKILCLAMLSEIELIPISDYLEALDDQFSHNSDHPLLLELEYTFKNTHKAIYTIFNYPSYIHEEVFGKCLFENIKKVYDKNIFSIQEFGNKMYLLWNLYIPHHLSQKEPFWTLSYADDCLSYRDEKQTRELYEKAFKHYD